MNEYDEGFNICPSCGYVEGTPAKEAYHLQPGSILNGKYIVGRALGYGGFGVTYIGYDAQLGRKAAIKEYMPSDFSTRMPGSSAMSVYRGDAGVEFAAGLQSFVYEAQRLAKFSALPGIVAIYDSFSENNTGYIVMEYLEGMTVKEVLAQDGPFGFDSALGIILSILKPLKEVHAAGIIHRDIAPDNIFLTVGGGVKLIDFGAARYATTLHSKSLSVILKPGYAPEEQYRSHGSQGPWSDVYAIAATFYKMLTGVTPDEAMDRRMDDRLKEPSALGVSIPKPAENAIMNALNINVEDRTQSVEEFEAALASSDVTRNKVRLKRADSGRFPLWAKIASGAAAVAIVAIGALAASGAFSSGPEDAGVWRPDEGYVAAPGVIAWQLDEAQAKVEQASLVFQITDKMFDSYVAKDLVLRQDPQPGIETSIGAIFSVVVSGGAEKIPLKDVVDMYKDDAEAELKALGFSNVAFLEEFSQTAPGAVLKQAPAPDSEISPDTLVTLIISRGLEGSGLDVESMLAPNLVGMNFSEAKYLLGGMGLYIAKGKEIYSPSVPKDQITAQSPGAGATLNTGDSVMVTVSLGGERSVPDVQYKTEAQARKMLADAGFSVQVRYEESASVQKGNVISQNVRAGSRTVMNSSVTITVSSGRSATAAATVTIPSVVGKSKSSASRTLTDLGMRVAVVEEYSATVAKDIVISQSAAGSGGTPGATVTIKVSLGKSPAAAEEAKVPGVAGKSEQEARSALQAAGFSVRSSEQYSDYIKAGVVISQDIPSGTMAEKGMTISIVVSRGPEKAQQSPVPDITWYSESTAKTTLISSGFLAGTVGTAYSDSFPIGTVISQSPSSGTMLDHGQKVSFVLSLGPQKVAELSSIYITSYPTKQEYLIGESLATAGLVVQAYYSDGTSKNVTSSCRFGSFSSYSAGSKTVTVSYSEKTLTRTASFTVTVRNAPAVDTVTWQTSRPPAVAGYTIEERHEYRYRDRETTTGTTQQMSGWTLYDTQQSGGTWSEWQPSEPPSAPNRQTESREVPESVTVYRYERWVYDNPETGATEYLPSQPAGGGTRESIERNSPLPAADGGYSDGGSIYYNQSEGVVQLGTKTEWRYLDAAATYYFERWGAWSSWMEGYGPQSTADRAVETQTLYRYRGS
jgi:beta-lactam-binding protein with PASTA domain/serine/threonine protein kinase